MGDMIPFIYEAEQPKELNYNDRNQEAVMGRGTCGRGVSGKDT